MIKENAFQNVVREMAAILPRCVTCGYRIYTGPVCFVIVHDAPASRPSALAVLISKSYNIFSKFSRLSILNEFIQNSRRYIAFSFDQRKSYRMEDSKYAAVRVLIFFYRTRNKKARWTNGDNDASYVNIDQNNYHSKISKLLIVWHIRKSQEFLLYFGYIEGDNYKC